MLLRRNPPDTWRGDLSVDFLLDSLHTSLMRSANKRSLTWQDLETFPDDGNRYELIEGEVFVTPAPFLPHQRIIRNLLIQIGANIFSGKLKGRVYPAPLKVVFTDFTVFEPDVVFIAEENYGIEKKDGVYGAPDLVVEVLSSNADYDRRIKLPFYLASGVKEVWLVDPEERSIEIYNGTENNSNLFRDKDKIRSHFPEISFDVATVFVD